MRIIVIFALLLAGCSNNEPSDEAVKAALNKYNDNIHTGCFELNGSLPISLDEMKQQTIMGKELDAYTLAGLVLSTHEGNNRQYELSPEGHKYYIEVESLSVGLTIKKIKHGAMCIGKLEADKITKVTPLPSKNEIHASYTYKIKDVARWSNDPAIQKRLPKVAALINGQQNKVLSEILNKTSDGWKVRDMRVR